MDDLPKLLATGLISFIIGILLRGIADRRALLQSVADSYLYVARTNSDLQEDQYLRIGALQSTDAAELRSWEFSRLRQRIVARGFRDPGEDLPLFSDRRRHVRKLLRWAAKKSIIIAEAETLLRIAAEEFDAQATRTKTPNQSLQPTADRSDV
jgi:hypothetical protein